MDIRSTKWGRKYLPTEWCSPAAFDWEVIFAATWERYFYLEWASSFLLAQLGQEVELWPNFLSLPLTSCCYMGPSECPGWEVRFLMSWRLWESHVYFGLNHDRQVKYRNHSGSRELHHEASAWAPGAGGGRAQTLLFSPQVFLGFVG